MRDSIANPIFTEPSLIMVVKPFRAKQPITIDALGWFVRQSDRLDDWPIYKRNDSGWHLWKDGGFLILTQTEPGEEYINDDFYIKTVESNTITFQGSYGYKTPDAQQQIEVYVWSPLDIVLSRIIEILRRHPDMAALVPERNLMDLSGGGILKVTKERRATSDYPEIQIEPGMSSFAVKDSTDFVLRQDYRLILHTEEQILSRYFFPAKWTLLQALSAFIEGANGGRLMDLFFVGHTAVMDIGDTMAETRPKWRSELSVTVEIFIPRSVLRSVINGK